jgi:macrodomain Ter protein organizer (MatP/YcbG family)
MSEKPVENKSKELSLMEKLQVEAKEGTKRFTIDLRESVHRKLSILSARTGRSKADIIRMVLDDVLKDVEE